MTTTKEETENDSNKHRPTDSSRNAEVIWRGQVPSKSMQLKKGGVCKSGVNQVLAQPIQDLDSKIYYIVLLLLFFCRLEDSFVGRTGKNIPEINTGHSESASEVYLVGHKGRTKCKQQSRWEVCKRQQDFRLGMTNEIIPPLDSKFKTNGQKF